MKSPDNIDSNKHTHSVKNLAAACGLYCGSCGIYLATQENDTDKLLQYAIVLNQSFAETKCNGCRAVKKSAHCLKMCSFTECTAVKGIEHCGFCLHFPCDALDAFQSGMPHRAAIVDSLIRLKESGIEHWLSEMQDQYQCTRCQTVNSAYDLACRNCGYAPCSKFVLRHMDLISKHIQDE